MPRGYDTDYQAFRRDWLHKLSNMDPDDIICELGIDTDNLIDALWLHIERFISKEYEDYGNEEGEDGRLRIFDAREQIEDDDEE